MKTATLAYFAALMASVHADISFQFQAGGGTGNYKGEIIQVPYDTGLGAHKDCIKHDEAANMVYISGLDTGESYCIYLYRTDKACGGCSDEMVDIFPSSVGGYEGLSEPAIASVVRKGACPETKTCPLGPA